MKPIAALTCSTASLIKNFPGTPKRYEKAAALLHSLACNHGLVDGNKRLALGALIAFYGLNGRRLTVTNDAAYNLVMAVASGALQEVAEIAAVLADATAPWS